MTPKTKKILWIGGIGAIVAVGAIIGVRYYLAHQPFVFAGTLETTQVILAARVASDIGEIHVSEGDMVSVGTPLMTLTCDAYKILGRQIDNDYQRASALVKRGHMSQAEFDIMTRNKQDNDLKLDWCVVRSPIDGMVTTRFREVGEIVAPGTTLISVSDPYDIWAYFYVPYDMLYQLRVGAPVTGILPEAKNMSFPGRIIKINEVAEFTPKNVQTRAERTRLVYGVKVRFDNPDRTLKSGMTIESTLLDE